MDLAPLPATVGWLYLPTAVALGALHGLEPGHSKTMIVSFLVAIRGTVRQAVLLGVSAALSHTAIIWVLALLAIAFRDRFDTARAEPWLQTISGAAVFVMAAWMGWRTWRASRRQAHSHSHHHHDHDHEHSHAHEEAEEEDAHARAHAAQIRKQLAAGPVTTPQVVLFGLTGGLAPCPSALAVLLLCLQARQAALGMGIVVAFSVGLALTLVAVGAAAAWSLGRASSRWPGLTAVAARAPYFSAAVLAVLGGYLIVHGARGI